MPFLMHSRENNLIQMVLRENGKRDSKDNSFKVGVLTFSCLFNFILFFRGSWKTMEAARRGQEVKIHFFILRDFIVYIC